MRRGPLIGAVAGATALVAVIGVGVWLALRPAGAADVAQEYLDALAAGDANAAVSRLACENADPQTLVGASSGLTDLVENPRVEHLAEDGGRAVAEVAYDLGGSPLTATMELTEGADGWTVGCSGVGTLTAATTPGDSVPGGSVSGDSVLGDSVLGDSVAVGAQILPAATPVLLLPGGYDVRAAPVGILEGSSAVGIGIGGTVEAAVPAQLSASALETAAREVSAYLDSCTAVTDGVPAHCGIRVPWAADLATLDAIAFRVESPPTVSLADDLSGFAATGGVLVATATGTTRDGATASFTYRTEDWSVRGGIGFEGNRMVLTVD